MNSQLEQLRGLIAARFPAANHAGFPAQSFSAGEAVELVPGKLVEVVAPDRNSGSGLLLLHLASQTAGPLAWVDTSDSLDLASLPREVRHRLLWLRGHGVKDSLKATDMLLRDGNLPTVLVDLRLVPERELLGLPSSIWHRLRMLAEKAHAAVGIFTPFKTVACATARWALNCRYDLCSLQEKRSDLMRKLHPVRQRGAGMLADAGPMVTISLHS